jgi:SAM-dependent methyltransferase
MSQTETFMQGEGDAWFKRNRTQLGKNDPVSDLIKSMDWAPESVLEIGCGTGWRLKKLHEEYGCDIAGIDPSGIAIQELGNCGCQGTADSLPFLSNQFDTVIFGFCLYLIEPKDLFRVVAESDRVLRNGGVLIVHDFMPSPYPFKRRYKHAPDVWAYHFDYRKLWLGHPDYISAAWQYDADRDEAVIGFLKSPGASFPERKDER